MAGAAGTEVGRISIKVTPDTEDFRRQLKRQLEQIEKTVRGNIPVDTHLDTLKAKAQLASSLAAMRAQARSGVTIPVRTDNANVSAAWKNIKDGLADLGRAGKNAAVGIRDYTREIKQMTLEQQKASPLLNHDLAVMRNHGTMIRRGAANLRDFSEALKLQQQWLRQQNPALTENAARWQTWKMALRDSDSNVVRGFGRLKTAFTQIKSLGNDSSWLDNITQSFARLGKESDDSGERASGAGRKIFGLTRIGWIIAAGFSAAAPLIGIVAGLIAGLPTLLMTAGAAAGAIAMGLDGIKEAAKTIQPQWDAMREAISERWQDGLTPIFQNLADKVFPVMETGMLKVTDGLLSMAGGVTKTLTSAQGLQQLETIFAGIGTFFTGITPAISQFTNSFLTLGSAGAQSIGHLTSFVSQFATQWQGMVDRVTTSGLFDQAMSGLSQALTGFTGLFTTLVESGLGAIAQLGGPLNTFFSGIGTLLQQAMPALTSFAGMLGNSLGTLAASLGPAFAALTPVVDALRPTIESLATTLGTTLSTAVGALAPGLTAIANALGPVLTAAAQALAPILTQVAQTLGTVLLAAVQALAPVMPQITAAFTALASAISSGIAQFLPAMVQAFVALLPVVVQLIPPLLQLIQAFIPLIPALMKAAAAVFQLVAALTPLISILANVIALVAQVVAKFIEWGVNAVAAVISAVSGMVSAISEGMGQFVQAIADGINKAVDWVRGLGSKVADACSNFGSILVNAGKALMDGLLNGIKAGWEAVKGFVGNIAGWIADLKGPLPYDKKVLVPNGEALMEGLNTGLENGFDGTLDNVKSMAKAIFEAVKEVFGSANGLALNFNFGGAGGGGGLAGGLSAMSASMGATSTAAKDLTANLGAAVNPAMKLTEDSKAQVNEYSRQIALLEQRRKELELAKPGYSKDSPEYAAIKDELERIRLQKLAIGLEKDKLTYAQKYEGTVSNTNEQYGEQIKKLTQMPMDFAKTTANQFLGDFGISGNGALPALANWGIEAGSKFVFNVSNVDEAIAVKNNQIQKDALGVVGR